METFSWLFSDHLCLVCLCICQIDVKLFSEVRNILQCAEFQFTAVQGRHKIVSKKKVLKAEEKPVIYIACFENTDKVMHFCQKIFWLSVNAWKK